MTDDGPPADARRFDLDVVRATAIVMVVVLHVSASVVVRFGRIPADVWWVANVFDAAMRPAVPLFVMVAGLLLLDPGRQGSEIAIVAARLRRVLIPFAGWAAVYFAWRVTYHRESLSFDRVLADIARGTVYTHLWFVSLIVGLYLVSPVLRAYVRHASAANQRYFVLLAFVATAVLPAIRGSLGIDIDLDVGVGARFCGYFVLGHLLRGTVMPPGWRLAAWAGFALLVALTAVGTYGLSVQAQRLDESLYDSLSPNVVLMSVLLFLLLRGVADARWVAPPAPLAKAFSWTADAAFVLYLMHPIVQEVYQGGYLGVALHGLSVHPAVGIPLATAATLLTCAVALKVVRALVGSRRAPTGPSSSACASPRTPSGPRSCPRSAACARSR